VLRHVLLEDVVLYGSAQLRARHALTFRRRDVEAEQDDGRPVDGHRRRDLIERDPIEQRLHVGETGDRNARLPDLTLRPRVIGVVAHERREIERRREARLPMLEQELEARVRVGGTAEPGELPHGPQLPAVTRRVDAASKRVRPRQRLVRQTFAHGVERRVQRFDFALAVGEGDVALFPLLITLAPRCYFGTQTLELRRLTT
jgi:hypothetical protein